MDEQRGLPPALSAPSDRLPRLEGTTSSGQSFADGHSRPAPAMTSQPNADIGDSAREDQNIPKFAPLQNHPPNSTVRLKKSRNDSSLGGEGSDDESGVAEPFERTSSPTTDLRRNKIAVYEKVGDQGVCKMHKFSLYETATRYYIVGADVMDQRFRILKIDRTADIGNLSIAEDEIVYTKKEMSQLLNTIDDGNKSTGGIKLKCSTWGLLGFIRFTGAYYMLLVTKRSQVAMIGGHYVYQIDDTELVPLVTTQSSRFKPDVRNIEESRFLGILNNLDLSRSFYYSYSYDITRTLQHNIARERVALAHNVSYPHPPDYNAMFVWNNYLLQPAAETLKNTYDWCLPVIHGYIDQAGTCHESSILRALLTVIYSSFNIWTDSLHYDNCETLEILRWSPIPEKRSK
jgi:phosphatidylinositol 3,5-bisphosphate 5-phosphatase